MSLSQRGDREAAGEGALHEDALGGEDGSGQSRPRSPRHHQETERRRGEKERSREER